jgi:hypothetical protein
VTISPALALHGALYAILAPAMGSVSVYDRVPQNAAFPFVHYGDTQLIGDVFTGSGSTDAHVNIHVFSRGRGKAELLTLEATVRDALENYIAVPGFQTDTFEYVTTRMMTEPDGLTEHAIIEFKYGLTAK